MHQTQIAIPVHLRILQMQMLYQTVLQVCLGTSQKTRYIKLFLERRCLLRESKNANLTHARMLSQSPQLQR